MRRAFAEDVAHDGSNTNVHLPSPSYWPLVTAMGLPVIAYGLIYNLWLCVVGGLFAVLGGIYGWIFEPADDPDADDHHGHDDHHDDDGDGHDDAADSSDSSDEDASAEGGDDATDAEAASEEAEARWLAPQ